MAEPLNPNITAPELKEKIDRKEDFQLIDVREPREHAINRIPGARLIPMGEVQQRIGEIDPDREVVVH
ncbi:MAG TPA: rhodanese-like domain-containing protein [Thermoanaerobaculia bacterium]